MTDDRKKIRNDFRVAVNMQPKELDAWLETEASRSVGQDSGDGESIGHRSGRRIVEIKRKTADEYSDADYEHMRKVVGYIRRHRAQVPRSGIAESNWRRSLMNWGHDPCKELDC